MAHLDHPPFFKVMKEFDYQDVESVCKVNFEMTNHNGCRIKSEVTLDSGNHGIEFLLEVMKQKFNAAPREQSWGNSKIFTKFGECLKGAIKKAWEETIADHYPDSDNQTTNEFENSGGALNFFTRSC